jgi:hypothetical protein
MKPSHPRYVGRARMGGVRVKHGDNMVLNRIFMEGYLRISFDIYAKKNM